MAHYSDKELLDQIRLHDKSAFNTLFDRYWDKLYRTARARLDDETEAKDIVQEVFIKLWQRRASLNIHTSFESYIFSAVRLSIISHFRSQKVTELQMQEALERMNLLETATESLTDYIELEKVLEEAVNNMPEMLKQVYLRRADNYSVAEIADELGIADQTVKNYMGEASRRLRIVIKEKYPEKHLTYMALILAILHK
jgi:RNA polymerase sigma-70 factor (ECF subfamily)